MLDHKDFITSMEDLKELRATKAKLEDELKKNNSDIELLVRDMVDYMEQTNQLSVKVKGVGLASLTSTKRYSLETDDRERQSFETFMKDIGEWELVNAVHPSKLQGWYKERLDLGEDLPPGVKTFIKTNITIRG